MSLSKKLTSIQNAIVVPKNQFNKFGNFYYRNLEDIQLALKPLLQKENCTLTMTDELVLIGDRYYIKATATISDGQETISTTAYARESESKKGMDDSQCSGSASSYSRKYALGGLLLLDDQKDADHNDNSEPQAESNQFDDKGWYNDFDKHKSTMLERIQQGEAPEQIIIALSEKYKVSKKVKEQILELARTLS
jgi:hypothetical protein